MLQFGLRIGDVSPKKKTPKNVNENIKHGNE
jgi:hypothetical protein